MSGNITVHGFVVGIVETLSGNNYIKTGIKAGGNVTTLSGNNYLQGEIRGNYSTLSGNNVLNGNSNSNTVFSNFTANFS